MRAILAATLLGGGMLLSACEPIEGTGTSAPQAPQVNTDAATLNLQAYVQTKGFAAPADVVARCGISSATASEQYQLANDSVNSRSFAATANSILSRATTQTCITRETGITTPAVAHSADL